MSDLPVKRVSTGNKKSHSITNVNRPTTSAGRKLNTNTHASFSSASQHSFRKFGVTQGHFKTPEDVIDELNALRKRVSLLNSENDLLRGRCRQLQETMERKEKELAVFDQPSESAKLLHMLGDNRPKTVRAFKQLHQKVFRLENRLLEKEAEYNRLLTDLKFTRIEELRIQLDTAVEEIHRLQQLLSTQSLELNRLKEHQTKNVMHDKPKRENKELEGKIATLGKVIKGMDEERQMLLAKNRYLMNRIRQLLRNDDFPPEEIEREINHLNRPPIQVWSPFHLTDFQSSQIKAEEPDLIATIVETTFVNNVHSANQQNELHATKLGSVRVEDLQPFHNSPTKSTDKSQSENNNFTVSSISKTIETSNSNAFLQQNKAAMLIQRAWKKCREVRNPAFQKNLSGLSYEVGDAPLNKVNKTATEQSNVVGHDKPQMGTNQSGDLSEDDTFRSENNAFNEDECSTNSADSKPC